jgi:pyruvate,orthophosphate dikinase
MLQTRSGKRTSVAAARIALDLMDEGVIDAATALQRTARLQKEDIGTVRLASQVHPRSQASPLAQAVPACPGVVSGEIALDGERVAARVKEDAAVILIRQDAETNDIAALECAIGLLTQRGARTSHAAVVARQLGKVCLVGCDTLHIDLTTRTIRLGDVVLSEGDIVTVDGNEGSIYLGTVAAVMVPDDILLKRLLALRKTQGTTHHRKHGK